MAEKERIERLEPKLKGHIYTFDQAKKGMLRGKDLGHVYVDNADILIREALGGINVEEITITGECMLCGRSS